LEQLETFQITGIVLAGGTSHRMGQPKAFLDFKGKALIRYPLDLLTSLCSEVLIVTKDTELYANFRVKVVTDFHSDVGPMAGIYAGLSHAAHEWCVVLACDLPFVRLKLLKRLQERTAQEPDRHAIIPTSPTPQVLCAAYSKTCLPYLERKIAEGRTSLLREMKEPQTLFIPWQELDPEDRSASSFINLNTPEEYEKWNLPAHPERTFTAENL